VKIDWVLVLAVGVVVMMVVLAVLIFIAGFAMAEELPGCQSIKRVVVQPGAVMNVVDGDTFHVFTFDVPNVVKIRVQDAETPERGQEGFQEAKTFTREWLLEGPFQVVTCGRPTLDRIAGVVVRDGETLADALKAAGYWRGQH
jgi:endonuclease YncB( thermonuclease family)